MKLFKSKILTVVPTEFKELTEEEKALKEAERIIKGLDYEEAEFYNEEMFTEFDFSDCAIDFNRELIFIRGNNDTITIQPFSMDMVIEEDFDKFINKYNKLTKD